MDLGVALDILLAGGGNANGSFLRAGLAGILAGRDTWNYDTAPPEIAEGAKTIGSVCERHGVPLPAAALQFPLAHPAVAAMIPAPRRRGIRGNLKLLQLPIPPALWADLRAEKLLHPDTPTPR